VSNCFRETTHGGCSRPLVAVVSPLLSLEKLD
jgi:hypothetical protein